MFATLKYLRTCHSPDYAQSAPTLNSGSGGYYAYATQRDTAPGDAIGSGTNQANYAPGGVYSVTQSAEYAETNYLTDVGAFSGSGSFYGTYDQAGNVFQWNDRDGTAGFVRGVRGGSWVLDDPFYLSSSYRNDLSSGYGTGAEGFRLASPIAVPEPSAACLALAGLACGGLVEWRRSRGLPG